MQQLMQYWTCYDNVHNQIDGNFNLQKIQEWLNTKLLYNYWLYKKFVYFMLVVIEHNNDIIIHNCTTLKS